MKKSVIGFIFGVILTFTVTVGAQSYFQFIQSDNTLYVDGTKVNFDMYNYEYTNYASIRGVAEALGLDITVTDKRIDFISPLTDLETVAKNCKDSCVMIYAYTDDMRYQGSGFIYNGYVITAKHVIEGAKKIDIFTDNSVYGTEGKIHYLDSDLDVGIIKAYITLPSVELGDSDTLKEGEKLVGITSPKGVQNLIDECINSGKAYVEDGTYLTLSESNMIDGASGGAIFNLDGEVVALVVSGNEGGNYTIPINDLKPILKNLK